MKKKPARWTKAYQRYIDRLLKKPSTPNIHEGKAYQAFRSKVLNRDDFTCVLCGRVGGYLEVHHLEPKSTHPEIATDVDNGVTLCLECHYDVHPDLPRYRPWLSEQNLNVKIGKW